MVGLAGSLGGLPPCHRQNVTPTEHLQLLCEVQYVPAASLLSRNRGQPRPSRGRASPDDPSQFSGSPALLRPASTPSAYHSGSSLTQKRRQRPPASCDCCPLLSSSGYQALRTARRTHGGCGPAQNGNTRQRSQTLRSPPRRETGMSSNDEHRLGQGIRTSFCGTWILQLGCIKS